ncbi:protein FATTY ACID EXPORT 2, chloroplastic-like isoform X2 [Durio zibethinus]|uniref:Protein FATTY ACID EXPORT 2, chloroplastic-like isoform X2 n=1 Tax=Durio zibethinus TaxID=66656 RepID=A0A6P5ZQS4_DURZI|nr:protein FATTY ACID EXPORT 2, chloroplastic-like isoform X2 [Durio zibethinus]
MGKENRNKASETKENIRKRMANLMVSVSLSSPLQLQPKLGSFQRLQLFNNNGYSRFAVVGNRQLHLKGVTVAGVVSPDSKAPTIVTNTVDSANGGIEVEVDTGNGGGDKFDDRSGGGGGGGGDNSGGGDSGKKGEGEFSDNGGKKNMALSMSQKLTIGYAALVGGVSAVLLVVMGSRFKRSRKIFPAGVVSLMSLVMTGGYLHGIMRSLH